jgi:signal transduction histidine kinase
LTRRIRAIQGGLAAIALAITVVIASVPGFTFAYRSPTVHIAGETTAAVISLLAAWLVQGRYRTSHLLSEFLLLLGFAGLAAAALANMGILLDNTAGPEVNQAVWIPLGLRLLADLTLLAAALAPVRRVRGKLGRRLVGAYGMCLGFVAAGVGILSDHLPTGVDPSLSPGSSSYPTIAGSPGLIAVQGAILALLVGASARFWQRARAEDDELLGWVGLALGLSALSRVNYLLYPSNFSEWVFLGDVFRLAAYIAFFIGAMRQIRRYQSIIAQAAVIDERRRMARDLHDGLAQHLSYIASRGRQLARRDPAVEPLASAAEHALADSRGAIVALSRPVEEPLETSVARMATMLASRHGMRLTLDLDADVQPEPEVLENLLRILSEAISNALRHSEGSEVRVALSARERIRLAVEDNGKGMDTDVGGLEGHAGFGLSNMKERVVRLGGKLDLRTVPGEGVRLEVELPETASR